MEKIDFVLPWVDATDATWQRKKRSYKDEIACYNENDHGELRYRDTQTLKYVLRSIEQNCPWYGKIVILTEGHKPSWIDSSHPKIEFVSHDEFYFYQEHLPTFNSTSIEMNLVNLENISEKFVYLNDDLIIWNSVGKERFFKDELPVDFLIHGLVPRNKLYQLLRDNSTWVKSLNNMIELINEHFSPEQLYMKGKKYLFHSSYGKIGKFRNALLLYFWKKYFLFLHWHHPQPFRKRTLKEVHSLYHMQMMECSKNRFRNENDLSQYLYRYYHLAKGDFFPFFHDDGFYLNIKSYTSLKHGLAHLEERNPNFVSIYDNYDSDEEEILAFLIQFLEKRFPNKASFEL